MLIEKYAKLIARRVSQRPGENFFLRSASSSLEFLTSHASPSVQPYTRCSPLSRCHRLPITDPAVVFCHCWECPRHIPRLLCEFSKSVQLQSLIRQAGRPKMCILFLICLVYAKQSKGIAGAFRHIDRKSETPVSRLHRRPRSKEAIRIKSQIW